MSIANIINVQITTESAKAVGPGFGVPLITSFTASWAERVRSYSSLTAVFADFAVTTPEYLAAAQLFAQSQKPASIKIGRCALPPTQRWAITPVAGNAVVYGMTVNGHHVTFTSDASGTVTEIIAGLKIAVDALSLGITVTDQTTYMRIVANAAGGYFSVSVDDVAKLGIAQDHADPGIATDLAAINLEDPAWYALVTTFNSSALVTAAAAWVESNSKLYVVASNDSAIVTTVLSGATDIAAAQHTLAHVRTAVIYSGVPSQFADASWLGECLPRICGSETWKFKTLSGVAPTLLTDSQRTNALNKKCNIIETLAGVNMTENGSVASGEWIDVIRFRDWLASDMSIRLLNLLLMNPKIPFTNQGISSVQAEVLASLKAGVTAGGLSDNPAPVCTVPKAIDVSAGDRAARNLTGVSWTAYLAGAIHAIDPLNGTIII